MKKNPKLIVALDVDTFDEARRLIDDLCEVVEHFKIGSQLFTSCGPVIVRHVLARQRDVFLDLKFHDIPNTVGNACRSAVGLGGTVHEAIDQNETKIEVTKGLHMLTVHTMGGPEMLRKAVAESSKQAEIIGVKAPLIVGITVLTSDVKTDSIQKIVLERAQLAHDCGLHGVVASSQEASLIRQKFGEDFVIVTPGIRPAGSDIGDQQRVTTPEEAIKNGSDYLVVGRPIVKSDSPLTAARKIIQDIKNYR